MSFPLPVSRMAQGYSWYVAVLYGMAGLLAVNLVLCVWVAWSFKEQKFDYVWPIKVRHFAHRDGGTRRMNGCGLGFGSGPGLGLGLWEAAAGHPRRNPLCRFRHRRATAVKGLWVCTLRVGSHQWPG